VTAYSGLIRVIAFYRVPNAIPEASSYGTCRGTGIPSSVHRILGRPSWQSKRLCTLLMLLVVSRWFSCASHLSVLFAKPCNWLQPAAHDLARAVPSANDRRDTTNS